MAMRLHFYVFPVLIVLLGSTCWSQVTYTIERVTGEIELNGELTEKHWKSSAIADDFITGYPEFGKQSRYKSNVRLGYDDKALYISAELHDPAPDSVSYSLSQRDDPGNADVFGIMIDPYGNNINAFMFAVTAAGVEIDGLLFTNDALFEGGDDFSWNAVWKSMVKKQEYGWSFEMKIPFSALRFPNSKVQQWNINFIRSVRRDRERSYWNPVEPAVFGLITQSGKLLGIQDVKSPLRLSFTPYATGYLENTYDYTLDKQVWRSRLTGGLDLKYGLNDAFTLDMTLIPDFGQTTSDKQVLNLGPFEVRFDENRPFFLEGTDLFSIGGVFYSRRIGAQPFNYNAVFDALDEDMGESVVSNPDLASMINGTKVSGRTNNGLGIGVFNAIERQLHGVIADSNGIERTVTTHPLSNYNVFVLSQNLKNNSKISFVNTNVMRAGASRDANVSVVETTLFSKDRKYKISSNVNLSSIFEDGQQSYGHSTGMSLDKVSGTWGFGFDYYEESDTYDPNDLGFLFNNNERFLGSRLNWRDFKSGKFFLRKAVWLGMFYNELYKPQLYASSAMELDFVGTSKRFTTYGLTVKTLPFGEIDHFESREFGKEVTFGPSVRLSGFISTDFSKRLAYSGSYGLLQFAGSAQKVINASFSPRVRVSDKMFFSLRSNWEFFVHDLGYVSSIDQNYSDEILLGYRDRQITENSLQLEFVFTKRMGLDLRLRHYWQQVEYRYFKELLDEGQTRETSYFPINETGQSEHNTNYNAFTIDLNYRWIIFPGSELKILYKNNIFNSQNGLVPSYFETFETLFNQPQTNSISMKLLVYVDALYFKRKKNQI